MREVTATELLKFTKYLDVSIYYLLDIPEAEEMNDVRKRLKEKSFPGSSEEVVGIKQKAM